jgi:hypothetical protein
VPGLDKQSAIAAVVGFMAFCTLSVLRFGIDTSKIQIDTIQRRRKQNMRQTNVTKLLGISLLETLWAIGTSSLATALSS